MIDLVKAREQLARLALDPGCREPNCFSYVQIREMLDELGRLRVVESSLRQTLKHKRRHYRGTS